MTIRWRRWLAWLLGVPLALLAVVIAIGVLFLGPPAPDPAAAALPPPAPAIDTAPRGGKPTLILLHGAGLNAHMWDAVMRHVDPRFRVIAIDLPGHGARGGEDYSIARSNEAIAAAARLAAPSPVILVGDSLGGYSAMEAAASIPPGQLRGLVVAGASEEFTPSLPLRKWGERVFVRWLLALNDAEELAPKALAKFGVAEQDRAAIVQAGVHLYAVEVAVDALMGSHPLRRIAAVPQPILFLNGDGDRGRIAGLDAFLEAAPDATSKVYAHTGHGVSMLRPADFAADLNAFAQRAFAADLP